MSWQNADLLKQQISLLDYLLGQAWKPTRRSAGGRLLGLCPLHPDHRPSFMVDPIRNLFYYYGCGRGGDVIGLTEFCHGVRFAGAIELLRRWRGLESLLPDVTRFIRCSYTAMPKPSLICCNAGYLSAATRVISGRSDRGITHRLRPRPMSAGLADQPGVSAGIASAGWPREC